MNKFLPTFRLKAKFETLNSVERHEREAGKNGKQNRTSMLVSTNWTRRYVNQDRVKARGDTKFDGYKNSISTVLYTSTRSSAHSRLSPFGRFLRRRVPFHPCSNQLQSTLPRFLRFLLTTPTICFGKPWHPFQRPRVLEPSNQT